MAKVLKIDRANLDLVKKRIKEALGPLEKELGLTFTMEKGTYTNAERGSAGISFVCDAPDGSSQCIGEIDFRRHAALFGLKPDDYGREFVAQGKSYKIAGIVPSSRKYPILGERADGQRYKFTVDTVSLSFKAQEAAEAAEKKAAEEKAEAEREAAKRKLQAKEAAEKAERLRREAEAAEEEMWVAPARPKASEIVSDAAKAMQDRLFG